MWCVLVICVEDCLSVIGVCVVVVYRVCCGVSCVLLWCVMCVVVVCRVCCGVSCVLLWCVMCVVVVCHVCCCGVSCVL